MYRPVKDPKKFVYHYTKAQIAIEHILNDRRLRFNPYNKTNDPLETKSWYLNIADGIDRALSELNPYEKSKIFSNLSGFYQDQEKIIDEIKSKFKLICFTTDNENQPTSSSLTSGFLRGWGHPRMWAQYADNHKGVCLMFEKAKLDEGIKNKFDNCKVFQDKVKYFNEPIPKGIKDINYNQLIKFGIKRILQLKVEENIKKFFFQKATDWRDEFEYRWVIQSNDNSEEYLFISIENSLRAIILGVDITIENEKKFINYSKKLKVRIYKMNWMNGNPLADKGPYLPWVDEFPNPV